MLLDLSSAFDFIGHSLLLDKMKRYGFTVTALKWIESYLTKRKQTIYFNGSASKVRHVTCGVPQGGCLGPLLFSIFINELPFVLKKYNIAIYADDSKMYATPPSVGELNNMLQEELNSVTEWISSN